MKRKQILIVLASIFIIKIFLNLTFKIQYPKNEYYEISEFKLNNSSRVVSGKIVLGENIKGKVEAIIYPDKFIQNEIENEVEYVYIRFYPEWFDKNMEPLITKSKEKLNKELYTSTKNIHEENFRSYMHINDYPIIKKDVVAIVIKKKDIKEKVRFTYNL